MHIKSGAMVSVLGALLMAGCGSGTPTPTVTVTATSTPTVNVVTFNPATSGLLLAGKIGAKEKTAGINLSGVECKNFPNIGTYADCQMRVNGVKQGLRATFTLRDGHYVLKAQKLTW